MDNVQTISTSTSQSPVSPAGDTVLKTGDFVGDFVDENGGTIGVWVSTAVGDSSDGAADGWSDSVGPVGAGVTATGGDGGDAGLTDGPADGSSDEVGSVGSVTGGITGISVSLVSGDGTVDGSSDIEGTERGTELPFDFGELTGAPLLDGAAGVAGATLSLDFGALTGPVIGVGANGSVGPEGTDVLDGGDTGAALFLDFGALTGTVIGVGADGSAGPEGTDVLDGAVTGAALSLDFGDATGDVPGADVPLDFGEGELADGALSGGAIGAVGAEVVVGTTGVGDPGIVGSGIGALDVGPAIGTVGTAGAGVPGKIGGGTGASGVGPGIGATTGASVSSGVTGEAVGVGTVGATGVGGNIEIWKLYSSESWHISPLGGEASAFTDAENSAAIHVLMLNDCTSDVSSPGFIGLISTSPSRSVVTPLKTISSFVTVMSTVPILVIFTLYSRVSKHEMTSSSRSHDSTRNAPNSLVRRKGADPDVSITLR